jgi:CBS domain containing-hemolysin-like protein
MGLLVALAGPLLLLLLVLANAFFVLAEFALITVDRGRVERMARAGNRGARGVAAALPELTLQLSGAQLGITLASLLIGFLAQPNLEALLAPLLEKAGAARQGIAASIAVIIALLVSTVAQMVLGEQVPKSVVIAHPMGVALLVVTPLRAFCWICRPLIALLNASANEVVRLLGVEPRGEIAASRSIDELEVVIRTSVDEGTLDRPTARLLIRAARFRQKTAADAMVPRVALVALPRRATAADLLAAAGESRHHRFPVYGSGLDDIVGVAGVMDALRVGPERRGAVRVDELSRPPLLVPESIRLDRLLAQMRRTGEKMVVAIDEYGGTAGIVTKEDLMEEAAGEIEDRPSEPPPEERTARVLPGTAPLSQVLDETGLELPEGEYATLAGFLLERLGDIPQPGDEVRLDGWALRVVAMEDHRIRWVAIRQTRQPEVEQG